MCSDCRYFSDALTETCWCKRLCVPVHEDSGPCIMFEPEKQHEVVLPVPVSAPVLVPQSTHFPVQKGNTSHVRIKVFK